MGDEKDYEQWMAERSPGGMSFDASERTEVEVKLYLDDERPCPVGWTLARSVGEAKDIVRRFIVTHASLDHDLGACSDCLRSVPGAAATLSCRHIPNGLDFVRWLVATGAWPPNKPTVHSANPVGRVHMRELIDRFWSPPATATEGNG